MATTPEPYPDTRPRTTRTSPDFARTPPDRGCEVVGTPERAGGVTRPPLHPPPTESEEERTR